MTAPLWTVEGTSPTVSTIRIKAERNKTWEQRLLISSDRHFDNPMSNRKMQLRHLNQAAECAAPILDLGDLYCAMQGKKDRRHEKSHVMEENQRDDYYDSLVDEGEKFFAPYAEYIALLGRGNHETAITKHNETDLTKRLVRRLQQHGSNVQLGGYRGWVRIMLEAGNMRQSYILYYTHGAGGNSPVTKGVIGTNRRAVYVDADIICSGHIHEAWCMELCRTGLTASGTEAVRDQIHLCVPTYKEEFLNQDGGFHHEKEGPPKPLGAWWLKFFWCNDDNRFKLAYERAK
jgi:hypothetical protein